MNKIDCEGFLLKKLTFTNSVRLYFVKIAKVFWNLAKNDADRFCLCQNSLLLFLLGYILSKYSKFVWNLEKSDLNTFLFFSKLNFTTSVRLNLSKHVNFLVSLKKKITVINLLC